MGFDPLLADIRFGCGRSPVIAPPAGAEAILAGLAGPDAAAARFPVDLYDAYAERQRAFHKTQRRRRRAESEAERREAQTLERQLRRAERRRHHRAIGQAVLRRVWSPDPFRERLVSFWADHFSVTGGGFFDAARMPYEESVIRPHVAGRFADMLFAVARNPLMLRYLDQQHSVGPNSHAARNDPGRGLNENFAREMLELHTLGVGGPYDQTDVRELAELLAGLGFDGKTGFRFFRARTEPGPQTVLGRAYGGPGAGTLDDIRAAFEDLATHPATARHLARKLAVHFVSDSPDPDLVGAVERAYLDSDGALMACYAALLEHPAAWRQEPGNVKPPLDFVSSALRALALSPDDPRLGKEPVRTLGARVMTGMRSMGHDIDRPGGPDGLPESDAQWIAPQRLAARVQWAVAQPRRLVSGLPDPRYFAETALGSRAGDTVRFAARAAETRWEGIGLVLASPAFQRM